MYERRKRGFGSAFASVFRGVDLARRIVLNLLFLAILIAAVAFWAGDEAVEVPESAALVIAPRGTIVEQLSGDAVDRALGRLTGDDEPETLKRELERAIRGGRDDERIKALVLDLNSLSGTGLSTLQDLRAAVDEFKTSGKPVIAAADFYGKTQYYLASAADEIYLHHMGLVVLDGYGRFRTYYKEGLDKAEIDYNVFRVGEYKSAVEPYLRDNMSEAAREANIDWLGDLWNAWVADVAPARNLTPETLKESIARFDEHLEAAGGDAAEVARRLGLVDHVGGRDAVRERLIELVGEDEETHSFHRIDFSSYLATLDDDPNAGKGDDTVAVVIASGVIQGGNQPPGAIGSESTATLIRDARHDPDVKAIVLRVDSPGGSAFASEVIRREFVLARDAGKKVVVSMGDVAASGGYWISSASDEIWANPNTITGSIGIFGTLPTFQKPLAKHLGTRVDGVGTTWISGAARADRALDPRIASAMQQMVEKGYEDFLARVGEARGKTRDEIDAVAGGRVWSGADAQGHGLVDHLGGLEDAVASAAKLAELGDDYRVEYLERDLDLKDQVLVEFLTFTADWYQPEVRAATRPRLQRLVAAYVRDQAEMLLQFGDPQGIYAHCLCEVR